MRTCRNGHEIEMDHAGKCPTCARASHSRRNQRYYQRHRHILDEKRRQRMALRGTGW